MSAEERTKKSSAIAVYILIAVILLLSYVLSIGPVIGMAERGYIGERAIPYLRTFYAPLQYIQDRSQTAARLFDWYCRFFVPVKRPSVTDSISLPVERDIEDRGGVGEGADADAVDAGGGDGADALKRDPAGGFELGG